MRLLEQENRDGPPHKQLSGHMATVLMIERCVTEQISIIDHPQLFHLKAYIRHLLNVDEISGLTLMTLQNVGFYLDFMRVMRQAILNDALGEFYQRVCNIYPD